MIFVDTGAWFALVDATDKYHKQAIAIQGKLLLHPVRWITTNFVIGETYTLLHRTIGFGTATQFIRTIRSWERLDCLTVPYEIELEAEKILNKYADQPFSYVDAVSFAVMRQKGIIEAFAFDRHFSIAGFTLSSI